jgi:hypothetical protein
MTEVLVRVKDGKSITLGGIEVEFKGEKLTPKSLTIQGGDIIAVPRAWYERQTSDVDIVLPPEPEKVTTPARAFPGESPAKEYKATEDAPAPVDPKAAKLQAMTYSELKSMATLAGITWSKAPTKTWLIEKLMEQG